MCIRDRDLKQLPSSQAAFPVSPSPPQENGRALRMNATCGLSLIHIWILETYAKQNGFSNLRWYTDDGYSGANFQRPGFQAMLADIEAGKMCIRDSFYFN